MHNKITPCPINASYGHFGPIKTSRRNSPVIDNKYLYFLDADILHKTSIKTKPVAIAVEVDTLQKGQAFLFSLVCLEVCWSSDNEHGDG